MKYIGFDIGSTAFKSVLLDPETNEILDQQNRPSPRKMLSDDPLLFEVSADEMVLLVKEIIDFYTANYSDIGGVLLSAQMHGFVYDVPGRSATYVSWQDMRCLHNVSAYQELGDGNEGETWLSMLEKIISPSDMEDFGVYLKPSLGIANLYAMLMEDSSIPRDGTLYTLGSYIQERLLNDLIPERDQTAQNLDLSEMPNSSHLRYNITHATSAAPIGIMNVREHHIDGSILSRLGLSGITLPSVADDFESIETIVSNGQTLRLFPDYGDMQVAILGSGLGQGEAVYNVATAAQVIAHTQTFSPGAYEVRPYFDRQYLKVISNMPGGRNLAVLVDFFKEIAETITGDAVDPGQIWTILHDSSPETSASNGTGISKKNLTVDCNFYENPFFPDGGAIEGINQTNLHMKDIFDAAVLNMAETAWHYMQLMCEAVQPDPGDGTAPSSAEQSSINAIICAGGVSWKTPELLAALSALSGKPVRLSLMQDEAAAGLLLLAHKVESLNV